MSISRWTCLAIRANEVKILETPDRWEAWICRDGTPHALVLSCPKENKADLEKAVQDIRTLSLEEIMS